MERPALKRLLADIEAGHIDIVVVYKIDRLTRSLTDFSKMIELFERHEVSFVSVTQQFNTTNSMGRLMLNILLSFAQFEQEVTRGVERLISEFRLTHQEAARRLGRSRDSITHLLRILKLEPPVLAQVEDGRLSHGHTKLLAGLPQPKQRHLADETIHKGLSVRALERRIRALDSASERRSDAHSRRDADIVRLEQRVGEIVGAETRVDYEPEHGRGRISFTFHSLEALEGILERRAIDHKEFAVSFVSYIAFISFIGYRFGSKRT